MNISIIGYGTVGKSVCIGFEQKCDVYIYDPAYRFSTEKRFVPSVQAAWSPSSFIFVCVPTPSNKDGHFDSAIIDDTMRQLADCPADSAKIVILKSTILPTKIKSYLAQYKHLNFIVMPEYLTEAEPVERFLNPQYRILGGDLEHTRAVEALFQKHSICLPCKTGHCDPVGASMLKYISNNFLALKVSFLNQFHAAHKKLGIKTDWGTLMELLHYDSRMGSSHYSVPGPDGRFGWGGRCLPKDVDAIIQETDAAGCDLSVMREARNYNRKIRSE